MKILFAFLALYNLIVGIFLSTPSLLLLPKFAELKLFTFPELAELFLYFSAFVVLVCIIAPIIEEFIFRHILQGVILSKLSPVYAIIITGLLFGLAHGPTAAWLIIPGIIFGLIYWLDGIKPAILAHSMFNVIGVSIIVFKNLF